MASSVTLASSKFNNIATGIKPSKCSIWAHGINRNQPWALTHCHSKTPNDTNTRRHRPPAISKSTIESKFNWRKYRKLRLVAKTSLKNNEGKRRHWIFASTAPRDR